MHRIYSMLLERETAGNRVRKDHRLRVIRLMVDEVLAQLSRRFDSMYASAGRPSIASWRNTRHMGLE